MLKHNSIYDMNNIAKSIFMIMPQQYSYLCRVKSVNYS